MSITVNGQSCVPPGFRFHPTEEELLNYYLRKKVASQKIDLDVIRDVDLNKLEPWDIQETCMIGSTPQSDWYFFSHKDRKYPTGTRTNRATAAGFWKATGRDKAIYTSFKRIGMRKTLVFYRGRAPHGHKSDWIMHEYRLDETSDGAKYRLDESAGFVGSETAGVVVQEDGWVICRVFKKKNHHRSSDAINNTSSAASNNVNALPCPSSGTSALSSQILHYMGRSCCKEEEEEEEEEQANWNSGDPRFLKLPSLHSPKLPWLPRDSSQEQHAHPDGAVNHAVVADPTEPSSHMSWAALDRLLAMELDVGDQAETAEQLLPCFEDAASLSSLCSPASLFAAEYHHHHHLGGDGDLWSLAKVASSTQSN